MANPLVLSPDELAQIPPNILNNLPALQPPAGIQSNFVNPEDRGYVQNSVASVLFSLMVCLFANRVYTKIFIVRKAGWDDLSCTIAFLGSIAVYIANLWGTSLGPVGKHQWDVRLVDILSNNFLVTSAIIVMITPFSLLFTKVTFFLLYFQVFRPLRWLRILVYIGAVLTCAFYGAATIAQMVFEIPKHGTTWKQSAISNKNPKSTVLSVPLAAIGLGVDIVLLIIPIVAVMGLQLPTKRKIGILFIFTFGLFACVGSLLSLYFRVKALGNPDLTWTLVPVETVGVVELFIGVSCACMPALSKMVHHYNPVLEKLYSVLSSRFASLRSSRLGGTTGHSGSSQSHNPSHYVEGQTIQGPYRHLKVEEPSGGDATPRPTYELGQLQSVQTFIGKGHDKGASDDQIHLTHEIRQQQTRAR